MANESDYNKRLFKGGLRAWIHLSRFRWLSRKSRLYRPQLDLVLELGCFDARSLDYLDGLPRQYYGFDANWEGGLDLAREKFENEDYHFIECVVPDTMAIGEQRATLSISLETLEHLPQDLLARYLAKLSDLTDGYIFISVPNEKGPLFLAKYLVKKLVLKRVQEYSFAELVWATFGRMKRVRRDQHKGFDYRELHAQLREYFDPIETNGIPFAALPLFLNSQVGFVMKSRPSTSL